MRRATLVIAAVALLLAMVGTPATAGPPPKGCPAEASIWTEVEYGDPDYADNSLYTFYFVTNSAGGALFAELNGFDLSTDEGTAAADALFEEITSPIDKNLDLSFCIFWIGGTPGQADFWVSIVDNNSATKN